MKKLVFILSILTSCAIILILPSCASSGNASGNAPEGETRRERRTRVNREKTAEYAAFMDSVILSENFTFYPESYYQLPGGRSHRINGSRFRMDYRSDYIDVNLPYYTGVTPPYRLELLVRTYTVIDEYTVTRDGVYRIVRMTMAGSTRAASRFILTVNTETGRAELEVYPEIGVGTLYTGTVRAVY